MVKADLNQKKLGPSILITNAGDIAKSPVMQLHVKRYELTKKLIENSLEIKDRPILIADLGCGTGYGCHMLSENSIKMTGADIDKEVVHYASKHYSECSFGVFDITKPLPWGDNTCDAIVCHVVFGGDKVTEDMLSTCKEIKRMLKKGGMFIGSNIGIMKAAEQVFGNIENHQIEGYEEYTGSIVFKVVKK